LPGRSKLASSEFHPASTLGGEFVGVFETLRSYGGVLFALEQHLARLHDSLATCGAADAFSFDGAARKLYGALDSSGLQDAVVRLTWVGERFFTLVSRGRVRGRHFRGGVAVRTAATWKNAPGAVPAQVKAGSYLNQILGSLEAQAAGPEPFEVLFLAEGARVEEGRISNLFIVRDGALRTPPRCGVLDGVTRRYVLQCARRVGIPAYEAPLTRLDLYNAEEAFLTFTSAEILPVREADGRVVGRGSRPLTRRLQRAFGEGVRAYVRWARRAHRTYR
jgi:branched-chain amino acid aminotransferase